MRIKEADLRAGECIALPWDKIRRVGFNPLYECADRHMSISCRLVAVTMRLAA
jgi:hypothetical protein